ncbi:MAG: hypothetical protein IJF53_06615 [Clostridia bacterium]|nr:hypothetical protein [Clostridia bacterium]
MYSKTCFFTGHRDTPESIFPALQAEVENHITAYGVNRFVVGHYGAFDRLAAKAVICAKQQYPHITLTMLLPYHPAEQTIDLPKGFDDTLYPEGLENVPRRFAISKANRYMASHSDYIIAYVWHPASNASAILKYAKTRNTPICNLADHYPSP